MQSLVPWVVAEAVALRVARHSPRSLSVHGDPNGRIMRVSADAAAEDEPMLFLSPDAPEARPEVLVLVSDGTVPGQGTRSLVLELASRCRSRVIVCEPHAPGYGLGLDTLRRLDAGVTRLESDEVPDAEGGLRTRKAWESPQQWFVADAAAWRFAPDAEELRWSFCARLSKMRTSQLLIACRRILQRHPTAFEPFALAAEELAQRNDLAGVRAIAAEHDLVGAPAGTRERVRRAVVACGPQSRRGAAARAG